MAGFPFMTMQVAVSALEGRPPWAPLQPFSAVMLGTGPLTTKAQLIAMVGGFILHFTLSALFGAVYTLLNAARPLEERTRWGRQLLLGMGYGVALWAINLQVVARLFFPTFLQSSQLAQVMIHALFFGLPLAAMYCGSERRLTSMPGPGGRPLTH